ncbi:MAG: hypothetical protein K2N63_07850, partial [Lachnospiraceae bacterium]|nr:hypothetical protein [Lachnospiraceae bacterium]
DLERCGRAQQMILPYLEDIRYQQESRGGFVPPDRKVEPAKPMPLEEKAKFVQHIRNCKQCHDELEFYLIVYVTTDMLDDSDIPNDYKEAVNRLLGETEWEIARAQQKARTGRFRLIAILLMLALALSLSVGRSAVEPEPEEITVRTKGFYLGELGLPKEIDFVDNAIATYHDRAGDFVFSQRLRRAQVEELWRFDVELMRAMYPGGEITYTLPTSFLLLEGSYAKRLEAGKRPEIMYQGRMTLRAFPKTKREDAPGDE